MTEEQQTPVPEEPLHSAKLLAALKALNSRMGRLTKAQQEVTFKANEAVFFKKPVHPKLEERILRMAGAASSSEAESESS